MKRTGGWVRAACPEIALALLLVSAAPLVAPLPTGLRAGAAPQGGTRAGTIEFVAHVSPTAGRAEPVRQLTFFLLRKSLADIQREVQQAEPKPDLDRFIEGLSVSKELKAWMQKKRWVELAGADFLRQLKANDILDVPEFYDAYLARNIGNVAARFPEPKYRERDRQQNPQKYEKQRLEYREVLRSYIENNPESVEGIEMQLEAINPGRRWAQQEAAFRQRIRKRALYLAQTRYLAAKTETDLEGRGSFAGVPAGEYWVGTLDTEAVAGDVRLRWDTPVTVHAGQATRLELSHLNALEPPQNTPARPQM